MNENNYFKTAKELQLEERSGNDFFVPAGDLQQEGRDFFKLGGDLNDKENVGSYFKTARDLNEESLNNIEDYLLTVVSGKRYPYESEMGKIASAASTVVSLNDLKKMVDEGYNIVSAEIINSDLINVEFQSFTKENNIGRGR